MTIEQKHLQALVLQRRAIFNEQQRRKRVQERAELDAEIAQMFVEEKEFHAHMIGLIAKRREIRLRKMAKKP